MIKSMSYAESNLLHFMLVATYTNIRNALHEYLHHIPISIQKHYVQH